MTPSAPFDFRLLRRSHIADQCVCCGCSQLRSTPAVLMPFVAHRALGWAPAMIDESWGLETIPVGMAYTVCRSLQCTRCHLLFADIRFSEEELGRLYLGYRDAEYARLRESYEPGYTARNEALSRGIEYGVALEGFLEPLLPAGPLSVLDWGGDSGKNTPLRHRARRHDVFDISRVPVIDGASRVARDDVRSHHYDLIACSHVLEHVPYPGDLVDELRRAMTGSTLLYVEVPFEEVMRLYGPDAVHHKRHWHEHVNFFSPESLVALLEHLSLRIVALATDGTVTAGLKSSGLIQVACRLA